MDISAKRITSFIDRSRWLGKVLPSPYKAAVHWVRIRFSPKLKAKGIYGQHQFIFRGMDVPILREIIHENEYDFLKSYLNSIKSPVILDVGAHIGLFSLCVLNISPKAQITSVEAGPETFQILHANMKTAREKHNAHWQAIHRAAWSNSETIKFNNTLISMSQKVSKNGTINVDGISLSELLKLSGQDKVDLMKVDVEGAEEAFLCAEEGALNKVNSLVIELHAECCDIQRVKTLLNKAYKKVEYIDNRNSSRPVLFCRKQ